MIQHNSRRGFRVRADGLCEIVLNRGLVALVDADDAARVGERTWTAFNAKWRIYAKTTEGPRKQRRTIYLHQFVMRSPGGAIMVDHRDGNGLDCRKENLRFCSCAQNNMNRIKHKRATSKFKGVYLERNSGKWAAQLTRAGLHRSLGFFDSEIEAAKTWDRAAVEQYGEFACLNFPQEMGTKLDAHLKAKEAAPAQKEAVN